LEAIASDVTKIITKRIEKEMADNELFRMILCEL